MNVNLPNRSKVRPTTAQRITWITQALAKSSRRHAPNCAAPAARVRQRWPLRASAARLSCARTWSRLEEAP